MFALSGLRHAPARRVRPSLRDPRFAFLLAGQSVNSIGSWASAIVLWGFAAYRFGASPEAISVTVVCWSVPPAVLGPLTGALADRFGPRALMIAGYLGAASAALAMATAGSLAFLDAMAAAYGVARSLSGPAGSALPPRVVEPDDLLAANSLLGVTSSIGQVAGPLAASVLLATAGFGAAFIADAATYLAGAIVLLPLPLLPVPSEPARDAPTPGGPTPGGPEAAKSRSAAARRPLRAATAGAVAVARDPGLRLVALASVAVMFTSGAFLVVEPLYARHVLDRPPSQFALFEAAIGIGAIATGLALPRARRLLSETGARTKALAGGAIGYGLAAALFTGTTWDPAAYLGAFAWGASGTVFYTVAATTLQRLAPAGTLGRVAGVISTAESATETAAMPLAGVIVAIAGIRAGALALAAVAVAAGVACRREPARPLNALQCGGRQCHYAGSQTRRRGEGVSADTGRLPPPVRRWPMPALIGYSFSEAPAMTTLTAVTAGAAGAAPVGITIAIGELVDGLTSSIGHGLGAAAARECYRWVALIVVLFFLTHLAESARTALSRALGRRVTGRLGERVMMAASGPATIGHLEDPGYLGRLARARGDGTIDMPPGEAVFGFSTKASMWVTSIGSAALLTQVTWGLGLIVFAIFVVIHSRLVRNYRIAVIETLNQTEKLRRTSYLRDVPTTPGAAREVRLFGLAAFFRDAYQSQWRPNMMEVWQRRREHRLFVIVVVVVTGVTVALVFYYLGYRAATGRSTVGDLAIGGLAVRALLQMLRADDDDLRLGFGSKAAAEALAFPVVASPGPDRHPWPAPVATISCADLRFRYGGGPDEVLHGLNLDIPAGQSLAIVGLNGAGKTTLARLMAGLDAPSGGSVQVGRIPIEDANRRDWQRQVVAVFQDFGRYELTVRDNIAFGSLAQAGDEDGLRAVARQAGLLTFIEGLPNGWDTVLSSGFAGGVDASGGQWQRIAIARALFGLRHGARLLIMDEPAASLDARAEAQLYDTFHELTAGTTTVAISHRFATVRKAERVIVLDHGQIIEDGAHEDLIIADGRYAELFRLQARRFQEASP